MTSPSRTMYSLPSRRSLPASLAPCSPLQAMKSLKAMTSARMKPRSKSVWITPAACGAVDPALHRPRPHFLFAGGEIGLQPQQFVGAADHAVQARLIEPQVLEELGAVFVFQLRDLRLDGRAHRDHDGAFLLRPRPHGVEVRIVGESGFIDVGDVHDGLERQQVQLAQVLAVILGERHGARRRVLSSRCACNFTSRSRAGIGLLVTALDGLAGTIHGLVDAGEIRKSQFGIDHVNVGDRIDATGHMHDVVVDEAAHHVRDRVGLADMRQELVAQALALAMRLPPGRRYRRTP